MRLVGLIHARRDPIGIYSGKAGKYSGRGWCKPHAASWKLGRWLVGATEQCGSELARDSGRSATLMLTDTLLSRASSLPQGVR
ncbi:hypothetical protein AK973_5027 [Pseudomonas brassicacearum]|nr:hypothetical protein AK973_5027 [Pseudomonas brassicacearum]